jgi:hypothetical protein
MKEWLTLTTLGYYGAALSNKPVNSYWRGRISTVDLLVLSNLDQLHLKMLILFTCFTKQVILMRRSTVLSLPLQLVFPEETLCHITIGQKKFCDKSPGVNIWFLLKKFKVNKRRRRNNWPCWHFKHLSFLPFCHFKMKWPNVSRNALTRSFVCFPGWGTNPEFCLFNFLHSTAEPQLGNCYKFYFT